LLITAAHRPQQSTLISQVHLYSAAYAVRLKQVQDLTQELASDLDLASSWLQVNALNV
jgi:hypothetical protein